MADTKISALTDGSPLQSTDDIPVARSGANRRVRIDLSAYATAAQGALADSAVQPARTITAGTGLDGGGDLSANRTLELDAATIASLALADSAVQPGDLATVATTGDYADLSNTPTIPSALSDLSDADTTGVQDGDVLIYVAANNQFESGSLSVGDFLADGSVPMTGEFVTSVGTFESQVADGASAVAYVFDTQNDLATSGAKLQSWRNNGTERVCISHDGRLILSPSSTGAQLHISPNDSGSAGTCSISVPNGPSTVVLGFFMQGGGGASSRLDLYAQDGDIRAARGFGMNNVAAQTAKTHIADADGTLADITTKFNTLLSYLESFGFIQTS